MKLTNEKREFLPYVLLSKAEVLEITTVGQSTIYEMMNPNSKVYDVSFPRPLKLTSESTKGSRTAWRSDEVYAWLDQRPRAEYGTDA